MTGKKIIAIFFGFYYNKMLGSKILPQAGLHRISDILTLVS